ncbi:ATP-binding protein [Mucilaginibacter sp. UR6-11]|uniref:ATP-binding protein n=1 Tax=Mucilaginibacter sp. UR6-11 TaxID=1435644 RepID=UPI001E4F45AC|nr:ATP-binding protein [Mucilaginibacter sp. UR6-11]MCC8423835.1 response regulator [Mucilaginibacter sp. UR6-11]
MNRKVRFSNFSIRRILSNDLSILDNARLRLLYYGLALSFFTLSVILADVIYQHHIILSITTGMMLVSSVALFKFLTYRPRWIAISHLILIVATIANLINIFIAIQNVDVVTVEVIIMIMLFGFYMLGKEAGLIYSLLNIVPVLTLLLLQYSNNYVLPFKPEKVDQTTTIIAVFACLALIAFIHSHFYNAFIKTIKELKETSDKQTELTAEFTLAIEKAQKSSEAKSEFLSTMSHEIRTPLNAVIGMSNLLITGNPRPDQRENLEVLKFSAGNLLSIVNDVLDFNKIESGRLVFENTKFNLPELMQNICGGQMMTAQVKGILFKLDVDSTLNRKMLFGDPTRITQIVFNLVSNAIKFTADGNIAVKATCIEDRHNRVTVNFSVKDTGIGIEQKRLNLIFEPFIQESTSTTRQYGGTGLGLAIVKRLLELQGLKMKVTSKPGVGSEFSFNMEFPVATEAFEPSTSNLPQITENGQTLSAIRMLIAEDNPVNVMLMKKLLSKWNIVPSIAENGERAVELIQYGNFDIILMDLQMPVMNGFDAAKEIRKMPDPKKSSIPIIALTASALFDIRERVQESGMNDYVSKPFIPNELFEKIQNLVANPTISKFIVAGKPVAPQ